MSYGGRLRPGPPLEVAGLLPGIGPDGFDVVSGPNRIVVQLPLPDADTRRPMEAALARPIFQCGDLLPAQREAGTSGPCQ